MVMTGSKGNKEAARVRYMAAIDNIKTRRTSLPAEKATQLAALEEQFEQAMEEMEVLLDHYEAKLAVLDAERPRIAPRHPREDIPSTEEDEEE